MDKIICFHLIDEPNGYLSNWYPSPFTVDGITYANITRRNIGIRADILPQLQHKCLAETHNLSVRFSNWIEI